MGPTALYENQPSAEIGEAEVQKLRTFYDVCSARATLCGDSCGRGSTAAEFLQFLRCARPSAEIRVVVVKN